MERGRGEELDELEYGTLLADIRSKSGFPVDTPVALGLPHDKVFFCCLRTELTKFEDVRRLLKFELEDDFPVAFDDLVVDICGHRDVGGGKHEYLIAAINREQIRAFMQASTRVGMKNFILSADACALHSMMLLKHLSDDGRPTIVIHADTGRMILAIVQNGNIVSARHWRPGDDGTAIGTLRREIEMTVRSTFGEPIQTRCPILLSGPDGLARGLSDKLSQCTDYDVACVDLKSLVDVPDGLPCDGRFTIALGLALMGLNGNGAVLNFLDADTSQVNRLESSRMKRASFTAACLLLLLMLLSAVRTYKTLQSLEAENRRVEHDIRTLYTQAFPDEKKIVNELAQMTEHLNAMRKEHAVLVAAVGTRIRPLRVLHVLSERLMSQQAVAISSFLLAPDGVRVTGTGTSFESVEQFLEELRKVPDFTSVELEDVALMRGSNRPEFRLQISVKAS